MKRISAALLIALLVASVLPVQASGEEPVLVTLEVDSPVAGSSTGDLLQVSGTVRAGGNEPVAMISADLPWGEAPHAVEFTLRAGGPSISSWTLDVDGDGSPDYTGGHDLRINTQIVSHVYEAPGTYSAVLEVVAGALVDRDEVVITVDDAAAGGQMAAFGGHGLAHDEEGDALSGMVFDFVGLDNPLPAGTVPATGAGSGLDALAMWIENDNGATFDVLMEVADLSAAVPSLRDPAVGLVGVDIGYEVQFDLHHNGDFRYRLSAVQDAVAGDRADVSVQTESGTFFCSWIPPTSMTLDVEFDLDESVVRWTVSRSLFKITQAVDDGVTCALTEAGRAIQDGDVLDQIEMATTVTPRVVAGAIFNVDSSEPEGSYTFGTQQANLPPIASLQVDPASGTAPLEVTFTMSASDVDGSIVAWELDVDSDGTAEYFGAGPPPATQTHTYAAPGNRIAALTVWDDGGAPASDVAAILIQEDEGGGGEEPDDEGRLAGTLRVGLNTCTGALLTSYAIDEPTSSSHGFQFVLDAARLPSGSTTLAFCFSGDGFVPVTVLRTVHVNPAPRGGHSTPSSQGTGQALPALELTVQGPSQVAYGSTPSVTATVTNPVGNSRAYDLVVDAPGVVLADSSWAGTFAAAGQQGHMVTLPALERTGPQTLRFVLTDSGGAAVHAVHRIDVTPPTASLLASIAGGVQRSGDTWTAELQVSNQGAYATSVQASLDAGRNPAVYQLWLAPGETRSVTVMFQAAPGRSQAEAIVTAPGFEERLSFLLPVSASVPVASAPGEIAGLGQLTIEGKGAAVDGGWRFDGRILRGGSPLAGQPVTLVADGSSLETSTDSQGRFTWTFDSAPSTLAVESGGVERGFRYGTDSAEDRSVPVASVAWIVLVFAMLAYGRRR